MLVPPLAKDIRLARPAVPAPSVDRETGGSLLAGNPALVATISSFAAKE